MVTFKPKIVLKAVPFEPLSPMPGILIPKSKNPLPAPEVELSFPDPSEVCRRQQTDARLARPSTQMLSEADRASADDIQILGSVREDIDEKVEDMIKKSSQNKNYHVEKCQTMPIM